MVEQVIVEDDDDDVVVVVVVKVVERRMEPMEDEMVAVVDEELVLRAEAYNLDSKTLHMCLADNEIAVAVVVVVVVVEELKLDLKEFPQYPEKNNKRP